MPNIKYLTRRILEMDYGAMLGVAKTVHKRTGRNTMAILADIISCGLKYQAGYMDYLIFEWYRLSDTQRSTYVTRGQNNRFVRLLNPQEHWWILEDKIAFLRRFDGFHGRDWMDLREASKADFEQFCTRHPRFVAKPISGTCGTGIEMIEISEQSQMVGLYEMLKEGKKYLIEGYVVQHPDISRIYPTSVNTLRLVTIRNKDTVHVVFSSIRLGNGKKVDNLNSGGMAAMIDMQTGKICSPGADKDGKSYATHPMTGVVLEGFPIPYFVESVELCRKAAMRLPELGYVGWDVAVTEDGPLLIEANHYPGHDIYQFQVHLGADRMGLLPRFEKAIEGLEDT